MPCADADGSKSYIIHAMGDSPCINRIKMRVFRIGADEKRFHEFTFVRLQLRGDALNKTIRHIFLLGNERVGVHA